MSPVPLLDRAHLDRQTLGDPDFARELLDLFEGQCRRLLPGILDGSAASDERADRAHTLRGSALGVGAERVARVSAEVEDGGRRRHQHAATLPPPHPVPHGAGDVPAGGGDVWKATFTACGDQNVAVRTRRRARRRPAPKRPDSP